MSLQKIKDCPGYLINLETKKIYSEKTKKEVSQTKEKVRLTVNGKRKVYTVSSLEIIGVDAYPETEAKNKASKPEKKAKAPRVKKVIEKGVYPYAIKASAEIEAIKKTLTKGDDITFVDYITKKKVSGQFVSHSTFSDKYPAARVSFTRNKKRVTKLVSYVKLNK